MRVGTWGEGESEVIPKFKRVNHVMYYITKNFSGLMLALLPF
jgi:hypothetical protein